MLVWDGLCLLRISSGLMRSRKVSMVRVPFFFCWASSFKNAPPMTDVCAFQSIVGLETEPMLEVKKALISDHTFSRLSKVLRFVAFNCHLVCRGTVGEAAIVIETGA